MSAEPTPTEPGDLALERLRPRVVAYWWCANAVGAAFIAAMLVAAATWLRGHGGPIAPHAFALAYGIGGAFALLAIATPPLAYARWRFRVDSDLLLMRYGILFHEERLVPVRRMQHVDLTRGPIERLFGLATLVVYTAGNEGSAFRVPGLAATRAQELRDFILRARGDDVL
jgi:membrane protein YdbS with pleckstrin-like domain